MSTSPIAKLRAKDDERRQAKVFFRQPRRRSRRRRESSCTYGRRPFEPQRRGGLRIGNLTSQFFANLYLDRFDDFVTEAPLQSGPLFPDPFHERPD